MPTDNTNTGTTGRSGPNTVFMPGDDRLADRRMGAVTPEVMVWGNQSLAGLAEAVIMMVDDEQLNIEMTEAFLEDAGYRHFVSTHEAENAIAMMSAKRPSLLLLDLSMPKVSGMQILKAMQLDAVLCHVPVIVLTSTHDPQVKLEALAVGAMDFLSKPVDPSELALRIRNTLAATVYRDYLAEHDPLTSLPNKHRYKEAVKAALDGTEGRKLKGALIHIGVDQLASVNDAMGRAVGDHLMQRIAKRLSSCVQTEVAAGVGTAADRPTLYRFDGDEFAVLLPHMENVETVAAFINKLLEAAATSFNSGGAREIFVTCCVGVAVFPGDGADLDILITNAGLALRQAKRSGRHNYEFFSRELNERALRSLNRGADLRRAFVRDQVELLFQPRADTATGKLSGADAVVRWVHPSGEVFEGDGVLELASTTEMSMALTEWMLERLGTQAREWRAAGLSLPRVSVRVSLTQLSLTQVGDIVRKGIRGGLQPQYLTVEFRGDAAAEPIQEELDSIAGLRKMGVRFALGHFGGTDSSLLQLRRLPLDELKIHPLFFEDCGSDKENPALLKGLLSLAKGLGLRSVATGITTARQLVSLKAQQCDECQGQLVDPPAQAAEFARRWLGAPG